MKKKLLSVVLSTAMVTAILAGCGSSSTSTSDTATSTAAASQAATAASAEASDTTAAAATGTSASTLAYKGEITMMHYSTSEESEGNGGSDGFRTMIQQWTDAHPDITLNQNVLANAEYKTQITTMASADDLPDVFLLQGMNTKAWAKQGLILDMTDIIKNSPDYANYNQSYFTPFTDGDKMYALPALTDRRYLHSCYL